MALPARRVLALIAVVAVILWLARPILGPFVVAAVIAYAFSPVVGAVQTRTGAPRAVVVAALFLAAIVVLSAIGWFVTGKLLEEFRLLARSGPDALAALLRQVAGGDVVTIGGTRLAVTEIARQAEAFVAAAIASPSNAIHLASRVVELSLDVFLTLIVTFYLLLDGARLRDGALRFLEPATRERAMAVGDRVHAVLGRWLRGQLLLVGLVAIVASAILGPVLHVPYALALGLLTGIVEVIPIVGPIAAAAIAALVAFSAGGSGLAIAVLVVYAVLRQVEDQVVAPVVIGRAVHLHPVVTIFAVLVGISTWGVLGGLLAVPVAAAVNVTLRELYPESAMAPQTSASPEASATS